MHASRVVRLLCSLYSHIGWLRRLCGTGIGILQMVEHCAGLQLSPICLYTRAGQQMRVYMIMTMQ